MQDASPDKSVACTGLFITDAKAVGRLTRNGKYRWAQGKRWDCMWQNGMLFNMLQVPSMTLSSMPRPAGETLFYRVKNSTIHGRGVFASRKIQAGMLLMEYCGDRISYDQACEDAAARDDDSNHTFLFSLEDGSVIDGGSNGNDARWINHCCEPNCEAREEDGRIFIHALRDIARGEELNYDYGLVLEERYTAALKKAYECRCGKAGCRRTMLAPKRRSRPG